MAVKKKTAQAKKTESKAKGSEGHALAREIIQSSAAEVTYKNMLAYGTLTIEDRAIPDFRDGLKPVHRRILWGMKQLGLKSSGSFKKSSKVSGEVMGNYHPHGDKAIYDAMVGMVNGAFPMVDGQGNFGWFNEPKAAAPRYTEARLLASTELLLLDDYYLAVTDYIPTYDNSGVEPVVLPAMLPMSLIVGCKTGIAVGATSKMPTFTKESVAEIVRMAAAKAAKTGKSPVVTDRMVMENIELSSEFGGEVISDDEELKETFTTGKGKIRWRCSYKFDAKERAFFITSVAPFWGFASGMKKLAAMAGVQSVSDESSGETIRIGVRLQKSTNHKDVEPALKKILESGETFVFNVTERKIVKSDILDSSTSTFANYSVAEIINEWFDWRMDLERKALSHENDVLAKGLKRENLMLIATNNLKIIFELLQKRGIDKNTELSKRLKISVEDAQVIWQLAVGRLDKLNQDAIKKRMADMKVRMAEIKVLLKNPAVVIAKQIKNIIAM